MECRWDVVGWGWRPATGMEERAQMTSRSPSWATFLQFHGFGEDVVSDGSQISLAYSSWWHQVAQEGKGFACHPGKSGFKLVAFHCCDESVGLSPHGMWLCLHARASCSSRARQQGCGSQKPCFQQSEELSQHLNHSRGSGCMGAVEPHHPRIRAQQCRAASVSGESLSESKQGQGGGSAGCYPGARPC